MPFSEEQKHALAADLDRRHVSTRKQAGKALSYIEAWHAIAEANRIFGFDGWSRETVEARCLHEREELDEQKNCSKYYISYVARVRITVWAGGQTIVREGSGAGHGKGMADAGDAHESALKEAESDAMKRALMTFGHPFGLALYDKSQKHVGAPGNGQSAPRATPAAKDSAYYAFQAAVEALGAPADTLAELLKRHKASGLDQIPAAHRRAFYAEVFRVAVEALEPPAQELADLLKQYEAARLDEVPADMRAKFCDDLAAELQARAAGV